MLLLIIILEEEGKLPVLSHYNQCEIRKTVINGTENLEPFNLNSIVEFYKSKCAELKIEPNHNLFQLFRYQGNPIQQKLDELLNPPA
jgi:hypothetical protein